MHACLALCKCSSLHQALLTSVNQRAPTLSSSSLPKHTRNREASHAHEVKGLTRLSPEKLRMSRYTMLTVKVVKQSGSCTMKVPPATPSTKIGRKAVVLIQKLHQGSRMYLTSKQSATWLCNQVDCFWRKSLSSYTMARLVLCVANHAFDVRCGFFARGQVSKEGKAFPDCFYCLLFSATKKGLYLVEGMSRQQHTPTAGEL